MSKDAVTYRSQDRIAVITIDKPERMNRIDADVVEGLHVAWQRFMASDADRVAVLTRRPAVVSEIIATELPRPRLPLETRESARFLSLRHRLLQHLLSRSEQ